MPPRDYYKSKSSSSGSKKSKPSQRQPGLAGTRTAEKIQKESRDWVKETQARVEADRQKDKGQGIGGTALDFLAKIGHGDVQEGYIGDEAFKKTQAAGQHKLRSQFDRLSAKYGPSFTKINPKTGKMSSQAQMLSDYLSGVPVERGGGLGARDTGYGGSAKNIDPTLEAKRQELLRQISAGGTDMASQLEGIRREGIGADLTPDQFFNFTQQLMAADPTPGNMAYKQARPWSSGYGVSKLASPAMSMLREGIGSFGNLIPPELKTMGRDFRTAAGDITGRPFEGFGGMLKGAYAYPEPFGTSGRTFAAASSVRPGGGGGGGGQQFAGQPESMYPQGYGDFLLNPPPPTRPGGITTPGFPDEDGDGIDDRWQAGPGQARPGIEQLPDQSQGVIGGMPGMYQPGYGGSIGKENEMRTADFQDRDRDGVDDRDQAGPGQSPWREYGQKFAGATPGLPQAPSAITPGGALAMRPITHQLQFQQPNQNWQQWNQNIGRFS